MDKDAKRRLEADLLADGKYLVRKTKLAIAKSRRLIELVRDKRRPKST